MHKLKKIFEKYGIEIKDEKFFEDLSVLLEATLEEKANDWVEENKEDIESYIDEKSNEKVSEKLDKIDEYLDYVVEEWSTENKVPVADSIKVKLAENMVNTLTGVLAENDLQVVKSETNEDYKEKVDEQAETIIELKREIAEAQKQEFKYKKSIAFMQETTEISDVDKEKLLTLVDNIVVENETYIDDFKTKLNLIKENFVKGKDEDDDNEDNPGAEERFSNLVW